MTKLPKTISFIKYYGIKDIASFFLAKEFQENSSAILELVNYYKNYTDLVTEDFILGYYILNLLFLYDAIKNNECEKIDTNFKKNYTQQITMISEKIKINNTKHAIKTFQTWALDTIRNKFKDIDSIPVGKFKLLYIDIIEIFINYPYFIKTEEEVQKLILLLDNVINPDSYIRLLEAKFSTRKIVSDHFKKKIEKLIKNQENITRNLKLVDTYLKVIKNDNDFPKKVITIIEYCQKLIEDEIPELALFTTKELISLINKYGLKKLTLNLNSWYQIIKTKCINSINWFEISFPSDLTNEEIKNIIITTTKEQIKNNRTIFYDINHKSSFWYGNNIEKSNPRLSSFIKSKGSYSQINLLPLEISQNLKLWVFSNIISDHVIFKIYTDNLVDMLKFVFGDIGLNEKERIFNLERYYEIVDQLNDENNSKQQNSTEFQYMKKNMLLLTAIESTIKIFIQQDNVTDVENVPFSTLLGNRVSADFNSGTKFIPSDFISNILSDQAKTIIDYYLYCPDVYGGKEIRNLTAHGSYLSKKFFNQYWFFSINLLFFQLIEEVCWNYRLIS